MGFLDKVVAIDRGLDIDPERPRSRSDVGVRYGLGAFLILLMLAGAAWHGHQDRRIADRLSHDGVEVDGTIVDDRDREDFGGSFHEVRVAFRTVDGRPVETWAVAPERLAGPTRVRYLRSDPSVARLACCPKPRGSSFALMVVMYLFFAGIGVMIYRAFRTFDRMLGLRS